MRTLADGAFDNASVYSLTVGECCIRIEGNRLVAGNDCFERTWRLEPNGFLSAVSFVDKTTGLEWLSSEFEARYAPTPMRNLTDEPRSLTLRELPGTSPVEAESLIAELTAQGETTAILYRFQIFPGVGGVRIRLNAADGAPTSAGNADPKAAAAGAGPTGIEEDPLPSPTAATTLAPETYERDVLDSLALAPLHLMLTQVVFQDRTDEHNELVSEREWLLHTNEGRLTLSGCLFCIEDILTGAGLVFLKEAPLPHARPVPTAVDLAAAPAKRHFTFLGNGSDGSDFGYAFVTLSYSGGSPGRTAALHRYQRSLRAYKPTRDGMLVANTWGDRNRDGRIRADFMEQEVAAGARLGVDVIQIDDGWQTGATSNSVRAQAEGGVWEGFYGARDNFWSVHPDRFPEGLDPLVTAARQKGMRFGLWFGPDSAHDFANWQRDADTIVRLHRESGIRYVKIDGVKVRTKSGERSLRRFFDTALTETKGEVVFDLDITAEVRPGYFGLMDVGPMFVENRYTDWRRYWPHQTLRNLWKLAHYVDPVRLRMEWLNHERNQEMYVNDPLAPVAYGPDYLFATVMFSSPLGWFEISRLPESYFAEASPLISLWKEHREAIFNGTILPVGDAPTGVSWTGFVSLTSDGSGAYLLLFREHNLRSGWSQNLPFLPEVVSKTSALTLFGEGAAALIPGRTLSASLGNPQRFLFAYLPF